MTDKETFIAMMKKRAKKFAVDVIRFCDPLNTCKASAVITYQLVKSATSTGANYRALVGQGLRTNFLVKFA